MSLRKSQVETLERIERHGALSPYDLSLITGRPFYTSRGHLSGLAYEGLIAQQNDAKGFRNSYVLTQAGKQALEDSK